MPTPAVPPGANAEDCPQCEGTNPPYPFICPGHPARDDVMPTPADELQSAVAALREAAADGRDWTLNPHLVKTLAILLTDHAWTARHKPSFTAPIARHALAVARLVNAHPEGARQVDEALDQSADRTINMLGNTGAPVYFTVFGTRPEDISAELAPAFTTPAQAGSHAAAPGSQRVVLERALRRAHREWMRPGSETGEHPLIDALTDAVMTVRDEEVKRLGLQYGEAMTGANMLADKVTRVRKLHDRLNGSSDLTNPEDLITRGAAAERIAAALDGWTPPAPSGPERTA